MLAAFAAFRERHYEPYLQYAALRIGRPGAAETAVAAAFTELAVSWTTVLGRADPAAAAWCILHEHIDRALGMVPPGACGGGIAPSLRQDAYLLHKGMRLSGDRIAELLGLSPGDIRCLLSSGGQE
ncbi:hypothetical protein [Streptomyces sp. NPDC088789]|uniref:hypothetical protein n=1 Tax=Streptomyces sp. NPDC088789 TaxID=3365899 RepID=UPI0037F66084